MSTIYQIKKQTVMDTPLLLFECTLTDGTVERWSTHRVTAADHEYEPRVLQHGGFDLHLAGDESVDLGARFTVTLQNIDGAISQLDRTVGWKGARLTVRFGFFNLTTGTPTAELTAVFLGIANPADELTETQARLSFTNRLSLQRINVPGLRIQTRCPWRFPTTADERAEAKDGGARGVYSPFYPCGYSPDITGGVGTLNGSAPFTTCSLTRADCAARGMLRTDSASRATARFGGFSYLPPSITVRAHGEKATTADAVDGRARANDAVPLVYGTAWMAAPVIFSRNDGNLTHCEALVSSGPIEAVHRVIANNVELPLGVSGTDMTATGWYNILSMGERTGGLNPSFTDSNGDPAGDPHGSMAALAVVLPNSAVTSGTLPKVKVLASGLQLARYDSSGNALAAAFTRNPAWILLDLLRRSGWSADELNLVSFAETAAYCDEMIELTAADGTTVTGPRFELDLALTSRKSLNEVVRGLRLAAALMVTVDDTGKLMLTPETTLAGQGASERASSNSTQTLNGGWPAYEFGDGLNGFSGILRTDAGTSTFRIYRRATSETANRLSVEFQDAFNSYQTDSLSLVDYADAEAQGCEIAATSGALGLPHLDQATRALRLQLQKNLRGNHYAEFETTVQALGLRPGDLIALSHQREGLDRAPYRVLRLKPATNYERVFIAAQRHDDLWYQQVAGAGEGGTPESESGIGRPWPLAGRSLDANGREIFEVSEQALASGDGSGLVELTVRYTPPALPVLTAPSAPVVGLTATIGSSGGTLAGGRTLYYAVTAVDAAGAESTPSFTVRATLPSGVNTYQVTLNGVRAPKTAATMNIYRGSSSRTLRRIGAGVALAATFTDFGASPSVVPPPDRNFDHARFEYRYELLPETAADIYSNTTIGNTTLGLLPNEFSGSVVRILAGTGAGAERTIASHTATTLTVTQAWTVPPGPTSTFAIAEAGWKPAGTTTSDEISFLVPNRPAEIVQISGVAASAGGAESGQEEAIVTRHTVAGTGSGGDADVPGMPDFGLSTTGQGEYELAGVGFVSLDNTNTIRTGTLTVHYWDELQSPSPYTLGAAVNGSGQTWTLAPACPVAVGDLIQVENELVRVLEITSGGLSVKVDRGIHETTAVAHASGTLIYPLARASNVFAFMTGFFGSAASGSYSQRLSLACARIAAAEFYVTNGVGSSPTAAQAYTASTSGGLRTLTGGQYALQLEGELAVMASIAPPLVVDAAIAVRDVRAYVAVAPLVQPVSLRVMVGTTVYTTLTIAAGSKTSNLMDGFGRAPLAEGAQITVEILSVGTATGSYPGSDLTVVIRI
jgi:hypothetical protein